MEYSVRSGGGSERERERENKANQRSKVPSTEFTYVKAGITHGWRNLGQKIGKSGKSPQTR